MSCGVGHRHGSDLALLWLWCRPVATALIQPIAWESPYAMGSALKIKKTKETKKNRLEEINCILGDTEECKRDLPKRIIEINQLEQLNKKEDI